MTAIDLLALALAAGAVVDIYWNGTLCRGLRRRLRFPPFDCDYCLTWQAAIVLAGLFYLPALLHARPELAKAGRLLVYALAAGYISWLINEFRADSGRDHRRTERAEAVAAIVAEPAPETPAEPAPPPGEAPPIDPDAPLAVPQPAADYR